MRRDSLVPARLGVVLARNLTVSLAGQFVVMLLAFVTTPYVINGLGGKSYGILMLLSTFLQLLSLQQLGANAGLIKFVAELFDKGDVSEINKYVSTALALYLVVGATLTLGSVLAGPWLIVHLFQIPTELHGATVSALYVVSTAFFLRFVAEVFFTIPMAAQRVHLATAVVVGSELLRTLGAVWAVHNGLLLQGVCAVLVVSNALFLVATIVIARRLVPALTIRLRLSRSHAVNLVRYSTAIGIFKINSHFGNVVDKLIVAHFFPIGLLGVYEVCYSLAQKLLVLAGNVVSVVFPTASTLAGDASRHALKEIYLRSTKVVLSLVGFPAVILCLFSSELLGYWINREFAQLGAVTLSVITSGFVVRSIGLIPHVICQATGRPSISARFALCQGAINLVLLATLVPWLGIIGAAVALLCSELAVTPLLFHVTHNSTHVQWGTFAGRSICRVTAISALTFGVGVAVRPWADSLGTLLFVVVLLLILYLVLIVWLVVDGTDRRACWTAFEQAVASLAR
jgi:O-antigen/teichoic acid export membrane protein